MSVHNELDTARWLDAMVRLTAPDGTGPNTRTRRLFVNPFYTDADSKHFDGGGFFSWGGENHFADIVNGRGHLTIMGFRVLMQRQHLLGDDPTPFNPNLMVTAPDKQLVRVSDRPDLLALWRQRDNALSEVSR
jgi:hypothetical protein